MAVLTQKEYEEKKGVVSEKATAPIIQKPIESKLIEYTLYHPSGLSDYTDEIGLNGRMIKREYKNGIIKTTDKELVDFLISVKHVLVPEIDLFYKAG